MKVTKNIMFYILALIIYNNIIQFFLYGLKPLSNIVLTFTNMQYIINNLSYYTNKYFIKDRLKNAKHNPNL